MSHQALNAVGSSIVAFLIFMLLTFIYAISTHDVSLTLFSLECSIYALVSLGPVLYYIRYLENSRRVMRK